MPKPPKPIGLVRAGEAAESERREIPPMPKPPKPGVAPAENLEPRAGKSCRRGRFRFGAIETQFRRPFDE